MTQRTETTITTLEQQGPDGRYIARIEGSVVDVTAETIETYATIRLPLSALAGFRAFLDVVAEDPVAIVAESEPTSKEE